MRSFRSSIRFSTYKMTTSFMNDQGQLMSCFRFGLSLYAPEIQGLFVFVILNQWSLQKMPRIANNHALKMYCGSRHVFFCSPLVQFYWVTLYTFKTPLRWSFLRTRKPLHWQWLHPQRISGFAYWLLGSMLLRACHTFHKSSTRCVLIKPSGDIRERTFITLSRISMHDLLA